MNIYQVRGLTTPKQPSRYGTNFSVYVEAESPEEALFKVRAKIKVQHIECVTKVGLTIDGFLKKEACGL